jgi:xanthine dehydrogenase accessory factor
MTRDIWATAMRWQREGRPFALATLTDLFHAKTAPVGTTMGVTLDGEIAGNIGAGCYEVEIIEAARSTAGDGNVRSLSLNLDDDDDLMGGTACGAAMRIVVWRPDFDLTKLASRIADGSSHVSMQIPGFSWTIEAKPRLIIVGATEVARELCAIARHADFFVRVLDPRPAFATRARVPAADDIVHAWPEDHLPQALRDGAALVVLSHDPKLDVPALACALRSDAWYVGLLGSRRAQAARARALSGLGFCEKDIMRVRGPVGLDLGGATAAETAVSILSELIAVRNGRSAVPLRTLEGAIH